MTEIQLTYTLRAAQLHSVSLAAAQLHVSQPSVSVQITRLEQELGFRIFDRDRKTGLTLTRSGATFLEGMNRIRQDYQALLRRCAEQNGGCTAARIGFFSAWDLSALLPGIRVRVAEQCPECALRLEAYSFRELVERLESGALDAILSVRTAVPVSSGLDVTLVGQTRAVLIYAAGHPLHTPGHPTLADFHKDTFLVQPSGSAAKPSN